MADLWLIAYDIADRRRLARVGKTLRRQAWYLQHSVYLFEGGDDALERLFDELAALIEPAADDVRAYRLTQHVRVWRFGRQGLPDGVTVGGEDGLRRLLLACASARTDVEEDSPA